MSITTTLILLASIAWFLQIIFGWLQIRRFNNAFVAMKKGKYIGVGRSNSKRFRPRVLVALSIDEQKYIIDSVLMKGITVFALPKKITQLHGININDIKPMQIFPNNPSCASALTSALSITN